MVRMAFLFSILQQDMRRLLVKQTEGLLLVESRYTRLEEASILYLHWFSTQFWLSYSVRALEHPDVVTGNKPLPGA